MKASQETEGVYNINDVNMWLIAFQQQNGRESVKLAVAPNVWEQLSHIVAIGRTKWYGIKDILEEVGKMQYIEDPTLPNDEILLS